MQTWGDSLSLQSSGTIILLKTTPLFTKQGEAYSPCSLEPEGRSEQLTPSCRLKGMVLEGRRGLVVLT